MTAASSAPLRSRRVRAFTMLEALLALFIFSMAVISLLEAVNAIGRTVLAARQVRQVQTRLESMLLEATRSPEMLSKMKTTQPQESKTQEGSISFIIRSTPLDLKNMEGITLPEMVAVSVTARWQDAGETQEMSAETWVHPPLYLPRFGSETLSP